jgi:SAM-dependent methyltransferase
MIDNKKEYQKMSDVESELWWYKILHKLCLKEIKQHFSSKEISIFDAGCGTGGLMCSLQNNGYKKIKGIDISSDAVEICKDRNLQVAIDSILNIDKYLTKGECDVIISNDVLYFLTKEEQIEFINKCHSLLSPTGILLLNLPALEAFKGTHDVVVHIKKRFTTSMTDELISASSFTAKKMRFWPFTMSPLIYLVRFYQRKKMKKGNALNVTSDVDLPPSFINKVLYLLVSTEISLSNAYPWGSSMFLTLKK